MYAFQNQLFSASYENIDCTKLSYCFVYMSLYYIRYGNSFSVTMKEIDFAFGKDDSENSVLRILLAVLSSFTLKNMLYVFIGAIIYAAFAIKYYSMKIRDHDFYNICFVCGLSRNQFSRDGASFAYHIKKQHSPWKYIYYLYYLESLNRDELTRVEHECWSKYCELDTSWYPIYKTMFLEENVAGLDSQDGHHAEKLGNIFFICKN